VHVVIVEADADELGEGPVWLPATQQLLRVDIARGEIVLGERRRALGAAVGFALPIAGGGLIAGAGRTLVRLSTLDAEPERLAEVEPAAAANRFNDAACDPRGRLWAGTMSTTREPGAAALYRVEAGGEPVVALAAVTVSNGLDWSPDATRLYYVDSLTQRIDAIAFDVDRGRLGARRPFASIAPEDGLPDGLTVDAEGGIWVCFWDGAALRRYAPDGALTEQLDFPAARPTKPAFGGPDLDRLYVTSATLDSGATDPGGAVFVAQPGVRGLPAHVFTPR
jgi:sugar lactone lactonase YvrE